jgi:hypothetical protein
VLLAVDAVAGKGRGDERAHRRLGLAVGDRHGRAVGLGVDRDGGTEVAALDRRRRVREAVRQGPGRGVGRGRLAAAGQEPPAVAGASAACGSGAGSSASERR